MGHSNIGLPFCVFAFVCRSSLASMTKTDVYEALHFIRGRKTASLPQNRKKCTDADHNCCPTPTLSATRTSRSCCVCLKGALNPVSKHLHQTNGQTSCSPFPRVSNPADLWCIHLIIAASKHSRTPHKTGNNGFGDSERPAPLCFGLMWSHVSVSGSM